MANEASQQSATDAFEARLDRDFGDNWISTIVGDAVADGIEVLRHPDSSGRHDDDLDAFLRSKFTAPTIDAITDSAARLVGAELRAAIIEDLGFEAAEDLASLLGPVDWVGGSDSSRFAVMVAGRIDVWVVRRNGRFATFETGDDTYDADYLSAGRAESADPNLRRTRLEVAERFAGLSRGVSIAGEDELDGELRDMTFTRSTWNDSYRDILRDEPEWVDRLVDEHLGSFLATARLDKEHAHVRLRLVIASGTFDTEAERDTVWKVWKQVRKY
jgi:hypothetical protein